MGRYILILLRLILSPTSGWEDLESERQSGRAMFRHGLLPIIFIVAGSTFLQAIYHPTVPFYDIVFQAIVSLSVYFVSYYIGRLSVMLFLPAVCTCKADNNRGQQLTAIAAGLMSLIAIIDHCLPMPLALIHFLPIYVAIILWQGRDYMHVSPNSYSRYIVIILTGLVAPPYILTFLFNKFIF